MLKTWLKTLPLISLWAKNRRLQADLAISISQNLLAIESLSNQLLSSEKLTLSKPSNLACQTRPITVSLTSYSERVVNVHHTIISLLNQSVRSDRLILWLAEHEYSRESLPSALLQLEQYGLEIRFCADIKSYKKLLPALEQFPEDLLVTFDDDVIYPSNQIERLLEAHQQYPTSIICHRAHKILKNKQGNPLPYNQWQLDAEQTEPSDDLMAVGIGGILYPPHCLDSEVFNQQAFMTLCPTTDDLWFKAMSLKAGTQVKVVDNPLPYEQYLQLPHAFQNSLWQQNMLNNDKQLKALLNAYPELTF